MGVRGWGRDVDLFLGCSWRKVDEFFVDKLGGLGGIFVEFWCEVVEFFGVVCVLVFNEVWCFGD